jgi:hypothetical protein
MNAPGRILPIERLIFAIDPAIRTYRNANMVRH